MEASERLSGYRREQWTRFKKPFGKGGQADPVRKPKLRSQSRNTWDSFHQHADASLKPMTNCLDSAHQCVIFITNKPDKLH